MSKASICLPFGKPVLLKPICQEDCEQTLQEGQNSEK